MTMSEGFQSGIIFNRAGTPYGAVQYNPLSGATQSRVITHDNLDHFDKAANNALPKMTPVFCQLGNTARITEKGFPTVIHKETSYTWEGITITRTDGKHGKSKILEFTGKVSGFIFPPDGEP